MKWSGAGLTGIAQAIHGRRENLIEGGAEIVRLTTHEAEIDQRSVIEHAVTPTGRRRVATQGKSSAYGSTSPGRIDSGQMINTTNTRTTVDGNTVEGRWGWFDPEEYYVIQDEGNDRIQAAHSLFLSWVAARGRLARRIKILARTGSVGS